MKPKDVLKIAWTNLTHRRLRSWLTLIGIFAGIATIVALISLGQGLEDSVIEQFASLGVDSFTIQGAGTSFGPPGTNAVGTVGEDDVEIIERVQGVKQSMGLFIHSTAIEIHDEKTQAYAFSMLSGEKQEQILRQYSFKALEGRIVDYDDTNTITLGSAVEFNGKKPQIGDKAYIKGEDFRVVGILEKTGNPIFDNNILMSKETMIEVFDLSENDYNLISVVVKDENELIAIKNIVERELRQDRDQDVGEEDFSISTPQDTLESFKSILLIVQILLTGIAGISLLVGSINITNTMYTSVLERRRDIGIMKAIGAKNKNIMHIFLVESGLLGMMGGIIGVILGGGIAKIIEIIAQSQLSSGLLQASLTPELIIGSLVFAFVLGALSGTLPARQASRLQPVDALRK
ncbi:MAG: ABC transporter permease [Nanobdellota archaeon]